MFTQVDILFKSWAIVHNNRSNLSTQTEINDISSSFIQIIINLVFSMITKPCLLFSQMFNTLLILVMNQFSSSLIKPLVLRLKPTSINHKRFTGRTNYCSKVIKSQINRYCLIANSKRYLLARHSTHKQMQHPKNLPLCLCSIRISLIRYPLKLGSTVI